jgi:hypothetical protein
MRRLSAGVMLSQEPALTILYRPWWTAPGAPPCPPTPAPASDAPPVPEVPPGDMLLPGPAGPEPPGARPGRAKRGGQIPHLPLRLP